MAALSAPPARGIVPAAAEPKGKIVLVLTSSGRRFEYLLADDQEEPEEALESRPARATIPLATSTERKAAYVGIGFSPDDDNNSKFCTFKSSRVESLVFERENGDFRKLIGHSKCRVWWAMAFRGLLKLPVLGKGDEERHVRVV
jgi:hypothetical protein